MSADPPLSSHKQDVIALGEEWHHDTAALLASRYSRLGTESLRAGIDRLHVEIRQARSVPKT